MSKRSIEDLVVELLSVEDGGLRADELLGEVEEQADSEQLARVFDVLAGTTSPELGEDPASDALRALALRQDRRAASAVLDVLLAGLPRRPEVQLEHILQDLPQVSPDEVSYLLAHAAVDAGDRRVLEMARRGITPLTIFDSIRAIELEIHDRIAPMDPTALGCAGVEIGLDEGDSAPPSDQGFIPYALCTRKISRYAECTLPVAERLFRWQIQVLTYVPSLYTGYRAGSDGRRVRIVPDPEGETEASQRWQRYQRRNRPPATSCGAVPPARAC